VPWSTYTNNTKGFNALTFMDLARNALTGTLPPELANISTQYLMLSVFDNNGLRGWSCALHARARTHARPFARPQLREPFRARTM
jgi:hypothetical protein